MRLNNKLNSSKKKQFIKKEKFNQNQKTYSKLIYGECSENNKDYLTNNFENNSNLQIIKNAEFLNSPKNYLLKNGKGIDSKFSHDSMKAKQIIVGNLSLSKSRRKFIESNKNMEFDEIYNNIFCSVNNFQDSNLFILKYFFYVFINDSFIIYDYINSQTLKN